MTSVASCSSACFAAVCAAMLAYSMVFAGPVSAEIESSASEEPSSVATTAVTATATNTASADGGVNARRDAERACLAQKKVLFPGDLSCHQLLTEGPCKADEWLVLDERLEDNLVLKCARVPCKPHNILWPEDGICHGPLDRKKLCPEAGNELQIDSFGEGKCACEMWPPHARNSRGSATDLTCFPLYKRGAPCTDDQVFVPVRVNATARDRAGVCKPDPCARMTTIAPDNKPPGGENHQQQPVRVLWRKASGGDGRCHELGSAANGRCPWPSSFGIDPETLHPACLSSTPGPNTADHERFEMQLNFEKAKRRQRPVPTSPFSCASVHELLIRLMQSIKRLMMNVVRQSPTTSFSSNIA